LTVRVSPLALTRKIIEALDLRDGEMIDLSRLRDGSVLVRKVDGACT
jgi:hypothetical protein